MMLRVILLGMLVTSVAAADELPSSVLDAWLKRSVLPTDEAQRMIPAFVEKQLEPLPLPKTLDEWQARRDGLRKEVLSILGIDDLVPAKWDLKLTKRGTIPRDDYRIEKLTFETYPGFANAALLYMPIGVEGRVPGIVSISGHSPHSKAEDYVQTRNVNLVKRGCIVLSYDYFGYGDRKTGSERHPTGASAHGIHSFSYSRRTATGLEVLDAIGALDLLTSLPQVDPDRIGFTGESGGSNSTYWIAAVDPRVKLAVPVSSVTTFDYWIRGDINWDWHQRPPGIRRIADIGTLLALHAPQPLVIITSKRGTDDGEFPLHEAEKSHQWAKHVYDLLDASDAISLYESTTDHGYQQDKREKLYAAVERWLKPPLAKGNDELQVPIEPVESLRSPLPENNQTFRGIYAEWTQPLPRILSGQSPDSQRHFLRERLGWPKPSPDVTTLSVARDEHESWIAGFQIVESEPGIRLPVICIGPKDARDRLVRLIPGRDPVAIERALKAGYTVVTFDLRAVGETRSGPGGHWSRMAGEPWQTVLSESNASWTNWSWFAGRPVPGQWAHDIAQVARFSCDQFAVKSVAIEATESFGWSALLAGCAEPELISSGSVTIRHGSLREDVRARGDNALADVPGLLEQLDVPQLRQLWPGTVAVSRDTP